ncbi:TRAP transporter small permease [Brevibacillus marinus]|uniref:TRAP transporter small permease n=1 Tax=Brevibacillus marinus TaxID=2496837 RepID=UPI000F833F54|nr:TRAP transporter small permease [Brevibacillus marinus]
MSLKKLLDEKLEEVFLVATLVAMVGLIFAQVVCRYLFDFSLSWSEELARYIHVWQIWLGASFAVRKQEHIRVEAFRNLFKEQARKFIDLACYICWFVMAFFLAVYGTDLVMTIADRGQKSPAMQLPMWLPYLSIPLGGLLMSIRLIQQIYFLFKPERKEA